MSIQKHILEALKEGISRLEKQEMLDQLLDKIGQVGMQGLTPAEKHLLSSLSSDDNHNQVESSRQLRYEQLTDILGLITSEDGPENLHSPVDITYLFDGNHMRFVAVIFDGNEIRLGISGQLLQKLTNMGWRNSEIVFTLKRIVKEELGVDTTKTVKINNF